jgi:enamine deaminase RidA (YjgF/YER057c/UK114 family)
VYVRAVGPTQNSGLQQSIYYARNIAGGSNQVTVTFNQAASYPDVRIVEYSGADPISPLNVTAAASGTGTTANSGYAQTTSANDLIFGAGTTGYVFTAAGLGFTNRVIDAYGNIAEDRTAASTGIYNATATTSSAVWIMQMAAFRPSTSP